MVLFLFHQLAREFQGGANVVARQTVFSFDFLEAHAAGEAADDIRVPRITGLP
jgi:hypothetical protein